MDKHAIIRLKNENWGQVETTEKVPTSLILKLKMFPGK